MDTFGPALLKNENRRTQLEAADPSIKGQDSPELLLQSTF